MNTPNSIRISPIISKKLVSKNLRCGPIGHARLEALKYVELPTTKSMEFIPVTCAPHLLTESLELLLKKSLNNRDRVFPFKEKTCDVKKSKN